MQLSSFFFCGLCVVPCSIQINIFVRLADTLPVISCLLMSPPLIIGCVWNSPGTPCDYTVYSLIGVSIAMLDIIRMIMNIICVSGIEILYELWTWWEACVAFMDSMYINR